MCLLQARVHGAVGAVRATVRTHHPQARTEEERPAEAHHPRARLHRHPEIQTQCVQKCGLEHKILRDLNTETVRDFIVRST